MIARNTCGVSGRSAKKNDEGSRCDRSGRRGVAVAPVGGPIAAESSLSTSAGFVAAVRPTAPGVDGGDCLGSQASKQEGGGLNGVPGVKQGNAQALEVLDVAGSESE